MFCLLSKSRIFFYQEELIEDIFKWTPILNQIDSLASSNHAYCISEVDGCSRTVSDFWRTFHVLKQDSFSLGEYKI